MCGWTVKENFATARSGHFLTCKTVKLSTDTPPKVYAGVDANGDIIPENFSSALSCSAATCEMDGCVFAFGGTDKPYGQSMNEDLYFSRDDGKCWKKISTKDPSKQFFGDVKPLPRYGAALTFKEDKNGLRIPPGFLESGPWSAQRPTHGFYGRKSLF